MSVVAKLFTILLVVVILATGFPLHASAQTDQKVISSLREVSLLQGKQPLPDSDTNRLLPTSAVRLTVTTVNATEVGLSWTDNVSDKSGFRIERAYNLDFTGNLTTFTVTANITTYLDTTVVPATTYYYRVFAFNALGDFGSSNTVIATTPSLGSSASTLPAESGNVSSPSLEKVTVLVNPDQDARLSSLRGDITLRIPKGAVSEPTMVELTVRTPVVSTGMRIVRQFALNALTNVAGSISSNVSSNISSNVSAKKVTHFTKDLEISIKHNPGELAGLDTDSLRLYYLDESTRQWVPIATSKYDRQQNILTATVTHFTNFGEQANPLINGPGRVMAADVNLHSGAAVFNYPIELPPGPGGFQPKLALSYNSGSVDEMKNKRSMGSWVGIGWSLHLGRISYDLETNSYYLDLNDASYQLLSVNGTAYRTNPEQYFKITRSSDNTTWELLDKEGNYYRFGGTTDSQQYVYDTSTQYYRWDISLWQDTNGNSANVTYVRDIIGTSPNDSVRSAYPQYLKYNTTEVRFINSWSENTSDGYLRKDNPISYGGNPAPKVMENRRLDSIEIKVSNTLVRKYAFAYNTTDKVDASDYSGIYYSGYHTLTSITQVGSDNTSSLPPITFTYQGLQTYRHTTEGDYTGNPGNPASFY